jgi:hypothetical protein
MKLGLAVLLYDKVRVLKRGFSPQGTKVKDRLFSSSCRSPHK